VTRGPSAGHDGERRIPQLPRPRADVRRRSAAGLQPGRTGAQPTMTTVWFGDTSRWGLGGGPPGHACRSPLQVTVADRESLRTALSKVSQNAAELKPQAGPPDGAVVVVGDTVVVVAAVVVVVGAAVVVVLGAAVVVVDEVTVVVVVAASSAGGQSSRPKRRARSAPWPPRLGVSFRGCRRLGHDSTSGEHGDRCDSGSGDDRSLHSSPCEWGASRMGRPVPRPRRTGPAGGPVRPERGGPTGDREPVEPHPGSPTSDPDLP
jgi:hypothetical protein